MDSLVFTPLRKKNRGNPDWIRFIAQVASAAILSFSVIWILVDMLGLRYGLSNCFAGNPLSGLVSAWNRIADTLGSTNYILLSKYESANEEYGLFITLCLLVLTVIAFLIVRSEFRGWLILVLAPIPILSILFGLTASPMKFVLMGLSFIFALIIMKGETRLMSGLITVLIAGLIMSGIGAIFGSDGIDARSKAVESIGDSVSDRIGAVYYGEDPLGHGNLENGHRVVTDDEALRVTMSRPQEMYLKGFIGANFDGRKWSEVSNSLAYKSSDLITALEKNGFNPLYQLGTVSEFTYDDAKAENVEITNVGADSRYAFVPYEMVDRGSLGTDGFKAGDSYSTSLLGREKKYSFSAVDTQTDNWTDEAARLFTLALGDSSASSEGDISKYMELESHYNSYVYDNYTYINVGDLKTLMENIGEPYDVSEGHLDYKVAINSIRSFLEEGFVYTENIGDELSGSPLKQFFDTRKGFDVHYATAATLMFRYFGIPARYVEGYLLTPEDAAGASENESISIAKNKAHAWTEIYIDGMGFVPLEVSPEFYGVMTEADMSVGISNDSLMERFQEEFGGRPSGALDDGSEESTRLREGGNDAIQIVLQIILLLIGLSILILLVKRLLPVLLAWIEERKMLRSFRENPPKEASAAIYGYMEKRDYPRTPRAIEIGNMAAYSNSEFDEKYRKVMLKELERGKRKAKALAKSERKNNRKSFLRGGRYAGAVGLVLFLAVSVFLGGCSSGSNVGSKAPDENKLLEETSGYVLETLTNPGVSAVGGDWAIIGLARAGLSTDDPIFSEYWDNVRAELKKGKGTLPGEYNTEYARAIMGLEAIGKNPRDVEGYDLLPYLDDFEKITKQGVTACDFALIASKLAGASLEHEDEYLQFIVDEMNSGAFYDNPKMTDYVSMTLQALSGYTDEESGEGLGEEIIEIVEKGIESLSKCQMDDGSMGNCEATVECIIALCELGIDPGTDERFIKNEKTLIDGLSAFYLGNGKFSHTLPEGDGEVDAMATEKALLALDALKLFKEGKTLYE